MEEPAPGEPAAIPVIVPAYVTGFFRRMGHGFVLVRPGALAVERRSGTNP